MHSTSNLQLATAAEILERCCAIAAELLLWPGRQAKDGEAEGLAPPALGSTAER